ncbi:MAG: hypothetical protein KDK34_24495 [Leptospiraceae bacterium]|nr:hypothetical protein [Leptospiraceae bacterium]
MQPAPSVRLAGILILAVLTLNCTSTTVSAYDRPEAIGPDIQKAPPGYETIRIVVMPFRNSASITNFSIIPDGDYSSTAVTTGSQNRTTGNPGNAYANTGTEANNQNDFGSHLANESDSDRRPGKKKPNADRTNEQNADADTSTSSPPDQVDAGGVAREVTETALFQTDRYEIVPLFTFQDAKRKLMADGMDEANATLKAARELNVEYLVYGDLTEFEIRNEKSYWKVPLWAIILVGSFFIQDDDLRAFIWYAMLRAATTIPLNSSFWRAGVGWEDQELIVDIGLDMRMVNTGSGGVIFSDTSSVERTETVRNLDLLVWSSDHSIKITRSSAGRQIRFAATDLINRLSRFVDERITATPVAPSTNP